MNTPKLLDKWHELGFRYKPDSMWGNVYRMTVPQSNGNHAVVHLPSYRNRYVLFCGTEYPAQTEEELLALTMAHIITGKLVRKM